MKYLAYIKQRERQRRGISSILDIIGIGEVTSETSENYGVIGYEITGTGLSRRLEIIVRQDGWRRISAIVEKEEDIKELTRESYLNLIKRIRER